MMNLKKFGSCLLACALLLGNLFTTPALAVDEFTSKNVDLSSMVYVTSLTRAYGDINLTLAPGGITGIKPMISFDAGEIVTFRCSYVPSSANVDFGIVSSDGVFYCVHGTNGSIRQSLKVPHQGSYYVTVENISSSTVTVTGRVDY